MVFSFFHQCLIAFREWAFFTFLARLISRHFILFDAVANEIILLISLSGNSLLVDRNVFLYPENLLN